MKTLKLILTVCALVFSVNVNAQKKEKTVSINEMSLKLQLPADFSQVGKLTEAKNLKGEIIDKQVIFKNSNGIELKIRSFEGKFAKNKQKFLSSDKNIKKIKIGNYTPLFKEISFNYNGKGQKLSEPESVEQYYITTDSDRLYELSFKGYKNVMKKSKSDIETIIKSINY